MPFTLVALRAEVLAALASDDGATWSDALLDEALRRSLRALDRFGPVYEATHTVSVAGADQDVSVLPGLLEVTGLAWPWMEEQPFEVAVQRWRTLGEVGRVRLRSGCPAVGDALRVRYRKTHSLEGLDGATATTVPAALRATLAMGGACYAAQLRARQAIENPALPADSVERLRAWATELERAFFVELLACTRSEANPVWEGVGL